MSGLKLLINQNISFLIIFLLFGIVFLVIGNILYESINQLTIKSFSNDLINFLPSISVTFFNNILSTICAIFIAFFITEYLYKKSSFSSSFLIVLISFPHISYCIGITYLFATSGIFARLFAIFYGNEVPFISSRGDGLANFIYIFSLALREVPFLVLIGLSVWKKINPNQIQQQVSVLGHSDLSTLMNCIFPLWIKSMGLPILIIIAFGFSNFEFSSILGPQFPNMINVKIIESWYSTNTELMRHLNSLIMITILGVGLAILLLFFLRKAIVSYFTNTRLFISINYNTLLIGKFFFLIVILLFTAIIFITFFLSISKSWFFPSIFPTTFTLKGWSYMIENYSVLFFHSIFLSAIISIFNLIIMTYMIEISQNIKNIFKMLFLLSLMILVIPQNIMLMGISNLMSSLPFFSIKTWFYFSLFIYILPYTYFMTKQSYDDFNPQYIENADVLGITRLKSFFYIKLPIMTNDFLIIFGVSFSVCFYQFLQGIIVTKGEELLFNNEVLILFSGESISTASSGSLLNFFPAGLLLTIIYIRYRYARM